jgi:FkbM family methyltransferase
MNSFCQKVLLQIYGGVRRSGFLESGLGAFLYEWAYDVYKTRLEAGPIHGLKSFVRPGGWVVDVGAHIGFFSLHFADWVNGSGRVLACEPDIGNLKRLRRRLGRRGLAQHVEVVEAAIGERDGRARLVVDLDHPGNHRLGEHGRDIALRSIDSLLAERNWPPVVLIKIDVQGAEPLVIEGATETLLRLKPALLVEIDPLSLQQSNFSAEDVIRRLWQLGYASYGPLGGDGLERPTVEEALRDLDLEGRAYLDLLFCPRQSAPS